MKYCIPVLLITSLAVCSAMFRPDSQTKLPTWLIGDWRQTTATAQNLVESWSQKNAATLIGRSVQITGVDTVLLENITIINRNDSLLYIPAVPNQNDGKPVIFFCTLQNDSLLVFENPEHDFPQKITYTKITADSVVAAISGVYKEQLRSRSFYMKKL
jgi:hypothetical protein